MASTLPSIFSRSVEGNASYGVRSRLQEAAKTVADSRYSDIFVLMVGYGLEGYIKSERIALRRWILRGSISIKGGLRIDSREFCRRPQVVSRNKDVDSLHCKRFCKRHRQAVAQCYIAQANERGIFEVT